MWRLLAAAFGWIVFGTAFSALFSLGMLTVLFGFLSLPIGAVVGAGIAIPGAILLTLVIGFWATPPRSPPRFVLTLEIVGALGALVGCSFFAWGPSNVQSPGSVSLAAFANGLFAVLSVGLSGRAAGRGLAVSHLRACGITPPASFLRTRSRRLRSQAADLPCKSRLAERPRACRVGATVRPADRGHP